MKTNILQRAINSLKPQKGRLLVVDNNDQLLKLFSLFFERQGYEVTSAPNLKHAEAKLITEEFDIILQDVILPDGDGVEFLHRIKELQPGVPVIILTGLGYDEVILQQAMKNGASGFLSKLLPLDQVLMEIHRVMELSGKPRASSPSVD